MLHMHGDSDIKTKTMQVDGSDYYTACQGGSSPVKKTVTSQGGSSPVGRLVIDVQVVTWAQPDRGDPGHTSRTLRCLVEWQGVNLK